MWIQADAPTGVSALAGDGSVAVSWTASASGNGSDITSYTVYAYAPGTTSPVLGQCSSKASVFYPYDVDTTCTVDNLTNNTPYVFTVVANNSAGPSAESAPSAAATPLAGLTLLAPFIARVGEAFHLPLPASGGTGNYSFALHSGTLPAGLSLIGAAITGTPTTATATAINLTVRVTDTGNSNSATNTRDVTFSIAVAKGSQNIQFTSTVPTGAKVGSNYTIAATGGASGNAVTFAIDASATSVCSIAGNMVSFNAKGNCVVTASQLGNANYEDAPAPTPQTIAVGKISQTIQFTSTVPTGAKVGGKYTVAATGGASGNAVTFAIDASASSVCSIAGSVVSFNAKGNCVVTASQLGNADYEDATAPTPQTIAVGQTGTGVVVTSSANPSKPGDEVSFTVTVTPDASKSAQLQTKAASVPTGTITVTDNGTPLGTATLVNGSATLKVTTLTTPGAHTIIASYSGDANNAAAQSAAFTQTVSAAVVLAEPTPVPSLGALAIVLLNLAAAALGALGLRWRRTSIQA
ncbi:Ig-like domain repeat protein [Comamonas sp. J-3]|uniref:Ig-like domain repeat protein n=1 Tax=Comamonas trifloxystrobinivorans TaxID=3350256 RepID=UPI00372773F7